MGTIDVGGVIVAAEVLLALGVKNAVQDIEDSGGSPLPYVSMKKRGE